MPDNETPDSDALEQQQEVVPEEKTTPPSEEPVEANEADVAEQSQEVPLDDEDYR